jgi:hypothetical protein
MLPREKAQARYQIHSIRDPRIYIFKLEKMDKDDDVNPLLLILLVVFAIPLLVFTL